MDTTTAKENGMTTADVPEFVKVAMAHAEATRMKYGLDVRCPVCNHGIGKFCTVNDVVHRTREDIALHPERVALANSLR